MPSVWVALDAPVDRQRWTFRHGGRDYLVLAFGERWIVTDAWCPHQRTSLAAAELHSSTLVCPTHRYTFALADGHCLTNGRYRLGVYEVRTGPDGVEARLPTRWLAWLRRRR